MRKYFYVYIVALLPYNIFLESMFKDILQDSRWRCSVKKGVLKNLKHLCQGLFLIKACIFIKERIQCRYLPVKFAKYLRTPSLKNICERLLLYPVKRFVTYIFACKFFFSFWFSYNCFCKFVVDISYQGNLE